MPAFSSHYIFAKELSRDLEKSCDISINNDALLIGTQGPDIFFFARIFPWLIGKPMTALGSKMHRTKPSVILENMRRYCESSGETDLALSYAYGFIMHYALDSTCHPYVYSMQNKITGKNPFLNPHSVHNSIEFSMDNLLLNKRMGIENPHKFDVAKTFSTNPEITGEIARLYTKILPDIYDIKVSEKQIVTAISDTKYVQRVTLDKTGIKKALLTPFETAVAPVTHNFKLTALIRPRDLEKSKKYGNIDNSVWVYPTADIKSNKSFEELFEQAKDFSLEIIRAFNNGSSMKEVTCDKSFLTGVET